jgi:hypothetical protein
MRSPTRSHPRMLEFFRARASLLLSGYSARKRQRSCHFTEKRGEQYSYTHRCESAEVSEWRHSISHAINLHMSMKSWESSQSSLPSMTTRWGKECKRQANKTAQRDTYKIVVPFKIRRAKVQKGELHQR